MKSPIRFLNLAKNFWGGASSPAGVPCKPAKAVCFLWMVPLLAVVWVAFPGRLASLHAEVIEEIIAQVNDKIIVLSEYNRSLAKIRDDLSQQGLNGLELEGRFRVQSKDALRDLIDQQLLVQKANDLGISVETDLVKKLDEIRRNMKLDSMEALEEAAEKQGMNYEDFKEQLRDNLLTQEVIQREVGSHVNITPAEIQSYYDQHKEEMARKAGVNIQEIVISTENKPTDQIPALRQKADDVEAKAKAGQDFSDLARDNSDAPSASSGGQAGFFEKGALAKELETAADALKPNEISPVIETSYGFVILKLVSRTEAGVPALNEVQNNIYEQLYMQRVQPALRDYLTRLRQDAYISIKAGYTDTGAAPAQAATAKQQSSQHP